ncbi:MAG: protein kinase domain-containing protein [Gloeotrichia echinulata DVL01]|jgi:serine/threonine protein kinase/Tfp pilus assembly protein PilF|nr:tetratricopeptide repeat protein [Gloeotrichia echinulata DEX184]
MNDQLLSGRYEIVQVLGRGAFGKTFLAKDNQRPGHPTCVVKQLSYSSQDTQSLQIARRLFKKEAEILEKLGQHDKIPTLLAEFEENEEFYLVQQFIDGNPLNQEILPGQPWNEDQVIRLLTEVLEILIFVHGQGVVHRDIKPANLMRRSADDKLVLIDFGAVKEIGTQTPQGQLAPSVAVGTLQYMPIEQLQGHPQFNSDIYALGMIAIQALSGLHTGELSKLRNPNSPNKNQVLWRNRVQVNEALADVIDKMVHSDSNERYQSASEVLIALGKVGTVSTNSVSATEQSGDSGFLPSIINIPHTIVNSYQKPRWPILAGIGALIVLGVGGFVAYNFLKDEPPAEAVAFYQKGLEKAKKGDKQGAILDFNQAIVIDREYPEAFYERANARFYTQDYPGTIEDASKAISLDSEYGEAYSRRCAAYALSREYEKAQQDCTQGIKFLKKDNPIAYDSYYNRGFIRHNLGDNEGAIADLNQAIALDPSKADAYTNLGLAYASLKDNKRALEAFNQAIKRSSKSPSAKAYSNRGLLRLEIKDQKGAIGDFTAAIKLAPKSGLIYYNRGLAYRNLKDKPKAIADFEQAKTLCIEQALTDCATKAQSEITKLQP